MVSSMNNKATLYWVTGLSGAGKTTFGTMLYEQMRSTKENVVFLDGDILRTVFHSDDYTNEGRKKLAYRYSSLCKMLVDQGIDVVICTIAMYEEVRQWNRDHISSYCEIYIKVSMDELVRRDQKQLYSRALKKEIQNVMGIDVAFDEPVCPDIVLSNDGDREIKEVYQNLLERVQKWKNNHNCV